MDKPNISSRQMAQRARPGYKQKILEYRPVSSQYDVVLLSRCNHQAKQNGSVKVDLRRIFDGRNEGPFSLTDRLDQHGEDEF